MIPETHLLKRGELARKQHLVHPGLPQALWNDSTPARLSREPNGPHYRKQLALWLTRPTHPLTARVMVNRIWQGHFGQGLVRTAGHFGRQGDSPSHRELLDWLACQFVDQGWSVKSMHRLIMLSDTYRRDSRFTTDSHQRQDPSNRYWWRMNPGKLEGEMLWDAVHQVAGTLNLKMGGRPAIPHLGEVEAPAAGTQRWLPASDDPIESRRRGIYLLTRGSSSPTFVTSHAASSLANCPSGKVATESPPVPWSLNDDGLRIQARELASRLVREAGTDPSRQVALVWQWTLARMPSEREKREAMHFLEGLTLNKSQADETSSLPKDLARLGPQKAGALTRFCLNLFNRDEFLQID